MATNPADERDPSNGWEAVAETFIRERDWSTVGIGTVRSWAQLLPNGGAILDLGCGPGTLRSELLVNSGFELFGVDASPSLIEAYRLRFPSARVACESVEESLLFERSFDGVMAWGLMFLLPLESQRDLIQRVARVLNPGCRFLFTAPAPVCTWADNSTGRQSRSLGAAAYRAELASAGLALAVEYDDEGENHYYDAIKQ